MAYGKIKADTIAWDNAGTDVDVTVQSLASKLATADIGVTVQGYDANTVKTAATQTLTNKTLTSPELSGSPFVNGSLKSNIVSVAALDINCSAGNYFTKTIGGSSTFTVSNVPASGVYSFTLELTHNGGTITWFSGVVWPGGTAPSLTSGKTHLFMFVTDDSGSSWRASSLINYPT